jgi:hypothetical protein
MTWIVLGLVVWVLVALCTLILMRMTGEQDRAARRDEKLLIPFSDVTVTQTGTG